MERERESREGLREGREKSGRVRTKRYPKFGRAKQAKKNHGDE